MWDILEMDWSEVKVMFNRKPISLPNSIMIRIWDKFKVGICWEVSQYFFI